MYGRSDDIIILFPLCDSSRFGPNWSSFLSHPFVKYLVCLKYPVQMHSAEEQIQYLECLLQKKGQTRQSPSPRTPAPHVPSWGIPECHDRKKIKICLEMECVLMGKCSSWVVISGECWHMWYHFDHCLHFFNWHELTCYNVAAASASRAWGVCWRLAQAFRRFNVCFRRSHVNHVGRSPIIQPLFARKLGPAVPQER